MGTFWHSTLSKKTPLISCKLRNFKLASSSSTMVEHSTHDPKIKSLNPAAGTGIEKRKNFQHNIHFGFLPIFSKSSPLCRPGQQKSHKSIICTKKFYDIGPCWKLFEDGWARNLPVFPFAKLENCRVTISQGRYIFNVVARQEWVPHHLQVSWNSWCQCNQIYFLVNNAKAK